MRRRWLILVSASIDEASASLRTRSSRDRRRMRILIKDEEGEEKEERKEGKNKRKEEDDEDEEDKRKRGIDGISVDFAKDAEWRMTEEERVEGEEGGMEGGRRKGVTSGDIKQFLVLCPGFIRGQLRHSAPGPRGLSGLSLFITRRRARWAERRPEGCRQHRCFWRPKGGTQHRRCRGGRREARSAAAAGRPEGSAQHHRCWGGRRPSLYRSL